MHYDPLYSMINPHITLVFPFESNKTNEELISLIHNITSKFESFHISLNGYSMHSCKDGYYLYLDVKKGYQQIIQLSNLLYNEKFAIRNQDYEYIPHITIGKFDSLMEMQKIFLTIKDKNIEMNEVVKKIVLEEIDENGLSIFIKDFILENKNI